MAVAGTTAKAWGVNRVRLWTLPAQSAMQVLGHKRTKSTSELSRLGVSGNTNQLGNYWPPKFLVTSTPSVLPARTVFLRGAPGIR